LTPARPHPLQDEDLPGGHQHPQDRTQALGVTHWSRRLLADQLGISHSTVARGWAKHDGKPWQTEAFRFSSDPELEASVRDVVGLSLDPSAHAIVLCGDE
jgi:IS30 family transposase